MLVTPHANRKNQQTAMMIAVLIGVFSIGLALFMSPWWIVGVLIAGAVYWWLRRTTLRRIVVAKQPFPENWERTLNQFVTFFVALDDQGKERFRNLVKIFLDEVAITGIRTEVDEVTRVLVAASAVIPIFGFDDWEYSGLGEVLIYPDSFNENYESEDAPGRHTLGMIGVNHLSGVMILSKPSLIEGFRNDNDKRNVGIHEFAHLVDKADGAVDGIPAGIPHQTFDPWVSWVGKELRGDGNSQGHIDDYAFTNEAEYFAVLSEYFFEKPETLKQKNPNLYEMLEKMYRQNPNRLFSGMPKRRRRVGRNQPCPCGSGEKYKRCCRRKQVRGTRWM